MDGHGEKYLELCQVVNYFFSDMNGYYSDKQESQWDNLKDLVRKLRENKLFAIFQHIKETNYVQP